MYVPHLWHPARIFLLWGPDRFMAVLKSAQVARIRHAVRQTQSLWQGREKNKPAMHFLASLGNIQRRSASRQRSKRRLPKEKFLWPLGFWNFFPAWPGHVRATFSAGKSRPRIFYCAAARCVFSRAARLGQEKPDVGASQITKEDFRGRRSDLKTIHKQEIK